ncbi:hypothetical protein AAH978_21800, partial [Streptomyces sp. ZYX-F-203]
TPIIPTLERTPTTVITTLITTEPTTILTPIIPTLERTPTTVITTLVPTEPTTIVLAASAWSPVIAITGSAALVPLATATSRTIFPGERTATAAASLATPPTANTTVPSPLVALRPVVGRVGGHG